MRKRITLNAGERMDFEIYKLGKRKARLTCLIRDLKASGYMEKKVIKDAIDFITKERKALDDVILF